MSLHIVSRALLISVLLATPLLAQDPPTSTASCNLDDGRQVYIRYNPIATNKEKISNGKPFLPGGAPMTLFTEAELTLGTSIIPVGAYTVYPIPEKNHWTLAINKNVTAGSPYDEKTDVARTAMDTAQVAEPAQALEVAFAHVGNRCSLRIYYGKNASFADFMAK